MRTNMTENMNFDAPIIADKSCSYFRKAGKPFFWLGDTAWLLFQNLSDEEAYVYLKNRADKGYNVIQAVLAFVTGDMPENSKKSARRFDLNEEMYWEHCDKIIQMAENLGMYMGLLPCWGTLVSSGIVNMENVEQYADFLIKRYGQYKNIIWILGGDIKADNYKEIYNVLGKKLKQANPERLVGYHPFGRCSSSLWFNDAEWLDFHMFQSGHRRYDQCCMGAWDDTSNCMSMFGEDNWKYVNYDRAAGSRPTLDGEPSYEWIVQGLHDAAQPYWVAKDVRRYAYWSVFAGSAGHTYGDNAIFMFFDGNKESVIFGVKEHWKAAVHHAGSGQMRYLKELMESVDYPSGRQADELIVGGQRERHERIAVFAGKEFLFAYTFLGKDFELDVKAYKGKDIWFLRPATGIYSYYGKVTEDIFTYHEIPSFNEDTDMVVVIK